MIRIYKYNHYLEFIHIFKQPSMITPITLQDRSERRYFRINELFVRQISLGKQDKKASIYKIHT
jgi:hypothetical protein